MATTCEGMWCDVDFEKIDFSYKWKISKFYERMDRLGTSPLQAPMFTLKNDTQWMLELHRTTTTGMSLRLVSLTKHTDRIWVDFGYAIIGSDDKTKESDKVRDKELNQSGNNSISLQLFTTKGMSRKRIQSECLVDGMLKLDCEISVAMWGAPQTKSGYVVPVMAPKFSLSAILEEARQQEQYSDVTLVTKTKEFKAHRVILAVHSSFFRTRFEERWKQDGSDKVEMNDLDPEVLETILAFMYTGNTCTETIEEHAFEMLQAAEKYDISYLKPVCEEHIYNTLSVENAIQNLVLADTHNSPTLKSLCLRFIGKNKEGILKSEGWKELKASENTSLAMDIAETFATSP